MNIEKKDIFQRVTDLIVSAIEEGAGAYRMPWRTSGGFPHSPINAASKRPYRGINSLVLWATAQEQGYKSGTWGTYKQWSELGAQVRKGEKSAHVVFWKFFDREEEQQDGAADSEARARRIPMARDYWVFNAEQVEGYTVGNELRATREERIESAEAFFRHVGIDVQPGGNRAFYRPETDSVHMPAFDAFKEPLFYYSVLCHETTHWSGADHRLKRDLTGRFGSESYAVEELIAELGAAFLCAELGLPTDPREDHAPYIASWLKVLKNDKRAIFYSCSKGPRGSRLACEQRCKGVQSMCISEQVTAQQVFLVSPARLSWGEYEGETKQGEGDISASYSGDRICEGKPIRKPFQWQGSLWVCVGSSGRGLTITKEHEFRAFRLVLRRFFHSEAVSYSHQTRTVESSEAAREHPMGFYHGIVVKHGRDEFVMCGPEATFIADEKQLDSEGRRSATPTQLGLF